MLRQPQGAARFLYNLLFLTAGSVLGALAAFLFTAYAANQLGEVTFGQFGTVQIFVNSFLIIADMGLMNVAIRDVAQRKDQTSYIAGNLLALKLVYGVVGFAVAVMLGVFLGYEPETQKLIVLFSLSLVFVSVGNAGVAVFNGHEAMGYSAAVNLSNALGYVAGIALLATGHGLRAVFAGIVVCSFVGAGFSLFILFSRFSPQRPLIFDKSFWHEYLVAALPFGILAILARVGVSVGPIMLSRLAGEVATGYFSIANNVINVFMLGIGAYNSAVYPLFSRLQARSLVAFESNLLLSMKVVLVFGLSIATGLTMTSAKLISLVFAEYDPAIPALQILAWFWFFALLSTPTLNALYAKGKQIEAMWIHAAAVAASIGANIWLVPALGVIGVCIALVVLAFAQHVLSFWKASRDCPMRLGQTALKSGIIAAAMAMVGAAGECWPLPAVLGLMAVVFCGLFFALRILEPEERQTLAGLPLLKQLAKLLNRS